MQSQPFLQLIRIALRANNRILFRNTNWTLLRNQNWALIGGNGSGKTLLARALAGEVPVVKGEIHYNFRLPDGKLPEDSVRLVSFELQKAVAGDAPAAARWFSLEQDEAPSVCDFLSQESVEEINPFEVEARREQPPRAFRQYRQRILDLLQIQSLRNRSLPSLSNGEMRKILLARALLRKPRLLILDDVFAGLDKKYRTHLKQILEKLMKRGSVRVLLVNPLPDELPKSITHMLCVGNCRVVAQGSRTEMMRHPHVLHLFQSARAPEVRRTTGTHFSRGKPDKANEELVKLEGASVRYNGRDILSRIHWTIRRGESWALIGPNGSGKSTLLSIISGDNPQAYANAVHIFGRRRGSGESVWDIKKRIGFISSELHLHFPEDQTCLETVISGFHEFSGCYRRPSSEQRIAARHILRRFGLLKSAVQPFGSLSAGSQRMVLLARALVKSPDLLLLDEPCQGLDLAHRTTFLRIIESLIQQQVTTIVYVTHRPDEIPEGIQRLLKLKNGRAIKSERIASAGKRG
jgi:molybdate transport system ATP-binding protein